MERSLYEDLKDAKCEIDNHESDLYVKANRVSREIIKKHGREIGGHNVSIFNSQIDGVAWYDIPFAFMPYWWDRGMFILSWRA